MKLEIKKILAIAFIKVFNAIVKLFEIDKNVKNKYYPLNSNNKYCITDEQAIMNDWKSVGDDFRISIKNLRQND